MIAESSNNPPDIWKGQSLHALCLLTLLLVLYYGWAYLGYPDPAYFWVAAFIPILHQVFVWVSWRRRLASSDSASALEFRIYLIIFFLLFASRFVSLFALGWMDGGSLHLSATSQFILIAILLFPGLYAAYSVARYFGMARAAGADHFDPRYRDMPFVKAGIFRFTNNGMYFYAFLLFWAVATGLNSSAALIVAAFSHAYIWVHFFATEKPDIKYLYS
ncbi:MAG: hypothetical protein GKR93_06900 [Gammaproteobacteria bacterium]|nr:hypothetical protein [Gammaproteobacteria bacterium]